MTVRQSFYISIAAHIMFFGSALAIAQYGRGLFLSSGDTMMVALVSPGLTSGNERGILPQRVLHASPTTNQVDTEKIEIPVERAISQKPAVKNEMPADIQTEPEALSMQLSGQVAENADAGKDDPGLAPASSGAGEGKSAQFGVISPSEWANLAAAIERTKNYPRLARDRGIEGLVRVRFRLTSSGTVEKIEIVQSSGSDILDSASIGAVYRAAPLPYVSGWVEMPMKYVLK
jgi:TonB family protein